MYSHPAIAHAWPAASHRAVGPALPLAVSAMPAAAHEAALTPPEWVHLIPAGAFSGRDGRGPYTLDAQAVLEAYSAGGIDLPIDYEHQSLEAADKAGPVPAAGWIKALEAREDGIWAQVAWTPRAAQMLTDTEYRYLSPVFRYDRKTGRVLALEGAGLTHTPNLALRAAASKGDTMQETIDRIRAIVGAQEGDDLVAAVQALLARAEAAEAETQAAHSREPDPAQYVPVAMHRQVADELARLQGEIAAQRAEAAVVDAMRAGKLAPGLKDWALAYASRDADGFAAFIAAAPVVVASGVSAQAPASAAHAQLTESDIVATKLLGMSAEAFAQAKQSQTAAH